MANMISGAYSFDPNQDYTSPSAEKARQDYAKALMYGAGQQPVHHWTQGLSNMTAALMGGRMLANTGEEEKRMRRQFGTDFAGAYPGGGSAPPNPTLGAALPSPPGSPQGSQAQPALLPGSDQPLPGSSSGPQTMEQETPRPPATDEATRFAQALAKPTPGSTPPLPEPGSTAIDPGRIPDRPNIDPRAMARMLGNPYANPMALQMILGEYAKRGQPIVTETPYGRYITNPRTHATTWESKPEHDVLDMGEAGKVTRYFRWMPDGKGDYFRQTLGSQQGAPNASGPSGAAPPAPPQPDADQSGPPDTGTPKYAPIRPPVQKSEATPTQPEAPSPGASVPAEPALAQAIATPDTGILPRANRPEPTPAEAPPSAGATPPPVHMAENMSGLSPEDAEQMTWLRNQGLNYAGKKEEQKQEIDLKTKTQDAVQNSAQKGLEAKDTLDALATVLNDPGFQSGSAVNLRVEGLRALQTLGFTDPNKTTPNDVFTKLRSSSVLNELSARLAGQGLGRILQSEVGLLNQTLPSATNSVAANRLIVEVNKRMADQLIGIGKVSDGYSQGYRIDPKTGDWKRDKSGKAVKADSFGTNTELKANINNWMEKHSMWGEEGFKPVLEHAKQLAAEEKAAAEKGSKPRKPAFLSPVPSATPEEALKRKLGQ